MGALGDLAMGSFLEGVDSVALGVEGVHEMHLDGRETMTSESSSIGGTMWQRLEMLVDGG